jgi:hypothetical protein
MRDKRLYDAANLSHARKRCMRDKRRHEREIPNSAAACISSVRIWTSMGRPLGVSNVVCTCTLSS